MFRAFFILTFTMMVLRGQAQADSLLAVYADQPNDTNKVNLLYDKGFALRNTDLPRAIQYARACYNCAEQVNNKHYIAKALNLTGILRSETGFHSEALVDLQRALALRIETRDTLSQAIILNNLGNVYTELNDADKALACYDKALQKAKSINNERWINGALYSMAELQTHLKMYPQAEGNLTTLINWAQQKNDYEILGLCYKNMALCKMDRGDMVAAESYLDQAFDIAEMTEDVILEGEATLLQGELFLVEKRFNESSYQLTEALKIFEKNQYAEGLIKTWKMLADLYHATDSDKNAYTYLQKHDSALAVQRTPRTDSLEKVWNDKKENTVALQKQRGFSFKDNIFECILVGALCVLLIVVIANRKEHEQKEQEK